MDDLLCGQTSLLTLPHKDFSIDESSLKALDVKGKFSAVETPPTKQQSSNHEKFILVQLPVDWSLEEDFENCHFLGDQNQVTLVSESKHTSYNVTKVETSNALVLVPPPTQTVDGEAASQQPSQKKHKPDMVVTPARLSSPTSKNNNSSGASFLSLAPRVLGLWDVRLFLNSVDSLPSVATTKAISVERLARLLRVSTRQVYHVLRDLPQAYAPTKGSYVWLDETLRNDVYEAILETLVEEDDILIDNSEESPSMDIDDETCNATKNIRIQLDRCTDLVKTRLRHFHTNGPDDSEHQQLTRIVRHNLVQLAVNPDDIAVDDEGNDEKELEIDFVKVARKVVRTLFRKQASPWERDLLVSRWQSQVPGVSKVDDTRMLSGLAIRRQTEKSEGEEEQVYWRFLPADDHDGDCIRRGSTKNANSATADQHTEGISRYLDRIFEARSAWTVRELQVYLDYLVVATGISQSDLMLRYTKLNSSNESTPLVTRRK